MSTPLSSRKDFAAWRNEVERNPVEVDPHLRSLASHYARGEFEDALSAFGTVAVDMDGLIRQNNEHAHLPKLERYDELGNRTESITFHPNYDEVGRRAYGSGIMSRYAVPGKEFETLSLLYLFARNGEGGHACPMACTAGLIKILQQDDADHGAWLERLLDPNYDTHFHGAQFMTEVQGGSDVGANAIQAREDSDGTWRITGEKWFCSVADAHLYLMTARPVGERAGTVGLKTFVVPRVLEDGSVNNLHLRRLKDKLGTRSMASAEIDFRGAVAVPVADFRTTVEHVLNTSRLYNAICSCGMLQRALLEARSYAHHRKAFGHPIVRFPTLAQVVARIQSESYASRSVTFWLAATADRMAKGEVDPTEKSAYRMLVNLNKFWTSITATLAIRDAIEVLGGNGAIESFSVLPRLLRDSIVCEAWEGGHNVLCTQALKDAVKMGLHVPMFDVLDELAGDSVPELAAERARWDALTSMPFGQAVAFVRDAAERLRIPAQRAALAAEARTPDSDPLLPDVMEHLRVSVDPTYDLMLDPTLGERVERLCALP